MGEIAALGARCRLQLGTFARSAAPERVERALRLLALFFPGGLVTHRTLDGVYLGGDTLSL